MNSVIVEKEIETCLHVLDDITLDRLFCFAYYKENQVDQAAHLGRLDRRFEEWHTRLVRLVGRGYHL